MNLSQSLTTDKRVDVPEVVGRTQLTDRLSYADFLACVQNSIIFPRLRDVPFNGVWKFVGT